MAETGQNTRQVPQLLHRSSIWLDKSRIVIARQGQTEAQPPHLVHIFWLITNKRVAPYSECAVKAM